MGGTGLPESGDGGVGGGRDADLLHVRVRGLAVQYLWLFSLSLALSRSLSRSLALSLFPSLSLVFGSAHCAAPAGTPPPPAGLGRPFAPAATGNS